MLPEKIYLLFGGTSPDGRGDSEYIGMTLDKKEAKKHFISCKKNPYSTGKVVVVTKTTYETAFAVNQL